MGGLVEGLDEGHGVSELAATVAEGAERPVNGANLRLAPRCKPALNPLSTPHFKGDVAEWLKATVC